VIGQTTSSNKVTLGAGDTANVTATGKAVYIGQTAGSNSNTLSVVIDSASDYGFVANAGTFTLNSSATLTVELNYTPEIGAEFDLVSGAGSVINNSTKLANGSMFTVGEVEFEIVSTGNRFALVVRDSPAVPEPATWAALAGVVLLAWAGIRRR
jgi:hypothetical protein